MWSYKYHNSKPYICQGMLKIHVILSVSQVECLSDLFLAHVRVMEVVR